LTSDQNLKVDRIYAGSYGCEDRDEYVWVFVPEPKPQAAGFTKPVQPGFPAPQIPKFSDNYKSAYLTAEMPVSVDHGIIGLMDPAWRGPAEICVCEICGAGSADHGAAERGLETKPTSDAD